MTMASGPLPPSVPIGNIDAFLAIVGQWNLYDMEVRAVRLAADEAEGPAVEADLYLPDDYLRRRTPDAPRIEHRFTFRFSGVSECSLVGFLRQNIVGEYEFSAAQRAYSGKPCVRVQITGSAGCEIDLLCDAVTVASTATRSMPDEA